MLGSDLSKILADAGYDIHVHDLPETDITRSDHLDIALRDVDIAVNCAAFTNVDLAEARPDIARAVNASALANMAELARQRGVFLAHISTDFVFDGQGDRPWLEPDSPHPISVYGRTKFEGEQVLQASGCPHFIMRVQWSYGLAGVNFITKVLERARGGGELKIVNDQIGAPTWTRDMSCALASLINRRCRGIYHFANSGYASRFETAAFILKHMGMNNNLIPCRTDEFPARAARPLNSRFDLSRISRELDEPIRSWQTALAEFLDLIKTQG